MKKYKYSYLNYGVPTTLADKMEGLEISVTMLRNTPKKKLLESYDIKEHEVSLLKDFLKRNEII